MKRIKRIIRVFLLRIVGIVVGMLGSVMQVEAQNMSQKDAAGEIKSKYENLQYELAEVESQYRAATKAVEKENLSERMGEIIDRMTECQAFLDVGMIDVSKISVAKDLELGLKLVNTGHPVEALTFLEPAVKTGNRKIANLVAVIYMDSRDFDKSIEFLEIACLPDAMGNLYPPAVYNYAQVFSTMAQVSESEETKRSYLQTARTTLAKYQKLIAMTMPADSKYALPPFSIKEYMKRGNPEYNSGLRYLLLGNKLEQEIKFQEMGLK